MEDKFRRQSVYGIMEEHIIEREKSHKRRSVFEASQETSSGESDKLDSFLSKWEQRWSQYNIEDIRNAKNVEIYSNQENLKRVLDEETEMWLSGIKNMVEKIQEFEEQTEYIETISHCDLPLEHRLALEKIDAKLGSVVDKANMIVGSCEVLAVKKEKIKSNIYPNIIKSNQMLA